MRMRTADTNEKLPARLLVVESKQVELKHLSWGLVSCLLVPTFHCLVACYYYPGRGPDVMAPIINPPTHVQTTYMYISVSTIFAPSLLLPAGGPCLGDNQ
ncbi:hypothetical protein BDQ94DRAFT_149186 [Aspergillus welwitschiae]|uniref:Uncharacterized protein n=1 Tax=Aspergillus welwitschiae TaxID=1341132 RepID=A0A3F3PTX0_9EURO|nr:hypothetical protein BDQ94DRAFT_149186 [Aspergillus welwitschiae]RDH30202.1 hypothetical protein BDQ94DRAFT_149186 [Aspergillus welwitschiae]